MYDRTDCGRHLRKYVGCSLAWWHNYKWAMHRLCTVFGNDFIAPFFHSLFPNSSFLANKMKPPALATILTIIRLSYPRFQVQLAEARASVDNPPRVTNLLDNLFQMIELFIPVVCSLSVCVLCCAWKCCPVQFLININQNRCKIIIFVWSTTMENSVSNRCTVCSWYVACCISTVWTTDVGMTIPK